MRFLFTLALINMSISLVLFAFRPDNGDLFVIVNVWTAAALIICGLIDVKE